MRKRRIAVTLSVICSLLLVNMQIWAKEAEVDTDIITEENFVPISKEEIQGMKDVAMGSEQQVTLRSGGPYWTKTNGIKKFYDAEGKLMYGSGSKYVIDVSEHNGFIDWNKVKAAGVDGAIIRVGYGYLEEDDYFRRNVSECNRLGIPYGIYLYSYAYDANFAYAEATGTAQMLARANVNLSYPIYYDIENFSPWYYEGATRKPPETVSGYKKVIKTYLNRMSELGYKQVHVYSYRSYLQSKLNDPEILSHVSWIAAYTDTLGYKNAYYSGEQGWQYSSGGYVNGISGRVDLNCFSNQFIKPSAKGIELSDEDRTMSVGSVYQLKATMTPANASSSISWRSGRSDIAFVDQKGRVTAKAVGKTWIYAKTNNGFEAKALVTVIPAATSVSINYSSKEIKINDSFKFKAAVNPSNASQAVTWRVGNENIATVDKYGNVKAVGVGSTYLYAKTWNNKEAKCLIKVTNPATSITLNAKQIPVSVGSWYQFKATTNPTEAGDTLTWRIGTSSIATVDQNGKVSAKAEGSTYVYAKTSNGLEAKALVKVLPAATKVTLNYSDKSLTLHDKYQLKATVNPSGASQSVTWRTGNSKVATVDKNGNVTAVGTGSTYVYAKTWNNKEAKCLIKVSVPATSITLNAKQIPVSVGSWYQFKATTNPTEAGDTLTWRIGTSSIATVDQNGKVSAKAEGSTYVYAKTSNGLEAKALVKVLPAATKVTLNYSDKSLTLHDKYQLKATVNPSGASQSVTWRTGNSKVATVDKNGNVTAVGTGSTYVYAKTWNNKEAKCLIKVSVPATSITLNAKQIPVSVGSWYQFKAITNPTEAGNTLTWRVDNSSIATVDQNGKVSAKAEGSTYVYAKTSNGLEAKALVKVLPAATGVTINHISRVMIISEQYQFKATVNPIRSSQTVTWRTDNANIATVDKYGNVTAVGKGNTWLYAKTWNNKETKCLIIVR